MKMTSTSILAILTMSQSIGSAAIIPADVLALWLDSDESDLAMAAQKRHLHLLLDLCRLAQEHGEADLAVAWLADFWEAVLLDREDERLVAILAHAEQDVAIPHWHPSCP